MAAAITKEKIIEVLKQVIEPDLRNNLVDLNLIEELK